MHVEKALSNQTCGHDTQFAVPRLIRSSRVFFGENISEEAKTRASNMVEQSSAVLAIGTSLATYSAYRLLKAASDAHKPCAMISIGPSRGDPLIPDELRFNLTSTEVLRAVLKQMRPSTPDLLYDTLSMSGIIKEVDKLGKFPSSS
jgi:NAD-dependent SIR2 family protein deacetylase